MSFATRDTWGRPVEVGTDHGHVTLRIGDRTAEFEPTTAKRLAGELAGQSIWSQYHRCGDCGEEVTR